MTCVGFTREALKYAKAKGITPVVMRMFEDRDSNGRITRIFLNLHVETLVEPAATIEIEEAHEASYAEARQRAGIDEGTTIDDDIYFVTPDGSRQHFNEALTFAMREAMRGQPAGAISCTFKPDGRRLLIGGIEAPYSGIHIAFAKAAETLSNTIVANRLAELIVQGVGDADIIIYDDQLRAWRIDENGEVVPQRS